MEDTSRIRERGEFCGKNFVVDEWGSARTSLSRERVGRG